MTVTDMTRVLGHDTRRVLEITYRPGTTDESVLRDVFSANSYRLDGVAHDIAGGVVIDVGANIGCVTLACLDRGARHVLAVEPEYDNRTLLALNVGAYQDRVRVLALAVGDPRRTPYVDMVGTAEGAYARAGTTVPVMEFAHLLAHLDDVLRDGERVALLKMNAESSEYPFFETATPALLARINRMVIQWHPPHVGGDIGIGHDLDRLLDILSVTHDIEVTGELGVGGMLYGSARC